MKKPLMAFVWDIMHSSFSSDKERSRTEDDLISSLLLIAGQVLFLTHYLRI
jgi:hypothetical protein